MAGNVISLEEAKAKRLPKHNFIDMLVAHLHSNSLDNCGDLSARVATRPYQIPGIMMVPGEPSHAKVYSLLIAPKINERRNHFNFDIAMVWQENGKPLYDPARTEQLILAHMQGFRDKLSAEGLGTEFYSGEGFQIQFMGNIALIRSKEQREIRLDWANSELRSKGYKNHENIVIGKDGIHALGKQSYFPRR